MILLACNFSFNIPNLMFISLRLPLTIFDFIFFYLNILIGVSLVGNLDILADITLKDHYLENVHK